MKWSEQLMNFGDKRKAYEFSAKEVVKRYKSNDEMGLSYEEVIKRLEEYGCNKLKEKNKKSLLSKFLSQFNDFMIIVLLSAAAVSFTMSIIEGHADFVEPIIILTIVVLNALLGFVQENKAEKSLEALKKMSSPNAKVIRNGKIEVINTEEIVIGDLIIIETGDIIPADGRLIEASHLKIMEAQLTGESEPIDKNIEDVYKDDMGIGDCKNMIFASSSVSYGHGKAIVTDTGMNTEVGKIANLIQEDESPETPLQIKLSQTGKILGIGALSICGIIFIMGLFQHIPPFDMFMTSVSLAVAAIPEGLPAIVTIMLAIGVQRMAKYNAVIRKLPAVETLGSANVICSDKTGTLTMSKMTLVEICDINGQVTNNKVRDKILHLSVMCNNAILRKDKNGLDEVIGDPTESALLVSGYSANKIKEDIERETPRVDEIPFDSKRKLMSTIHKMKDGGYISITKGAPDVLLNLCEFYYENGKKLPLNSAKRKSIQNENIKMGEKALRVIAISFREWDEKPRSNSSAYIEKGLIFMGLVGMIDPPRKEVKEAIKLCKNAGIKTVMITGDHVVTAIAIAKKIGLMGDKHKAMTGEELNQISQKNLIKIIDDYRVFARVSPEHKVRIVKAYQEKGNVVAMTGDGVNDAPALKSADIGCAMGKTGTDVAKNSADMILTDDNFATIVHAVREGRGIYANIKKAVHFLLSSNIGEILTIFIAMLLGWQKPLLAIHLLWVNLVTDALPAIALGLDLPEDTVMTKPPYKRDSSLFVGGLWQTIIVQGIMIGLLSLIAFGIGSIYFDVGSEPIIGRTMAFATLSISQLVHAFNMRSEKSILKTNIMSNPYLVGAFAIGLILQISVINIPFLSEIFRVSALGTSEWLWVSLLSVSPLIIVELEKLHTNISSKRTKKTAKKLGENLTENTI